MTGTGQDTCSLLSEKDRRETQEPVFVFFTDKNFKNEGDTIDVAS